MPFGITRNWLVFVSGFTIGILLTLVYEYSYRPLEKQKLWNGRRPRLNAELDYIAWFRDTGLTKQKALADDLAFGEGQGLTEAEFLHKNVTVICIVFVKKASNAYAVSETWARQCNMVRYFSRSPDSYLDVTVIGMKSSWQFLCDTLRRVWSRDMGDKDGPSWALFTPDDVYTVMENLRFILAPLDAKQPHYFGHNAQFWGQEYNAASAGYVLSRAALEAVIRKFNTAEKCEAGGRYFNNEDYYLGKYLSELGIKPTDCRDTWGRQRFHTFTPAQLMAPGSQLVLTKYSQRSIHPVVQGHNCCSPTSITFQGTENDLIFFYNYLLYNVKVFTSGHLANNKSRVYTHSDQVWQRFILDEHIDVDMNNVTADLYYQLWTMRESSPSEFNKRIRDEHLAAKKNRGSVLRPLYWNGRRS